MITFTEFVALKEGDAGRALASTGIGVATGAAVTPFLGPAIGAAAGYGATKLASKFLPHRGSLDATGRKMKKS